MRLGHSSRSEAWTALYTNISTKLKYPLHACTLTEAQCRSIMYPVLRAALPRTGISSKIVADCRDGPISTLGVGCISLFHFMGTSRTTKLIDQVGGKSPLGDIIMCNIEDIVVDSGLFGKIWDMPFIDISKYIDKHSWVYAILAYNADNNISLNIPHRTNQPKRK